MSSEATPTIESKIKAIQKEMEKGDPDGLAPRLKVLSVKAIYEGFGSPAWYEFMQEFAGSPKQLKRLCTRDLDCHDYNEPARAYLVGNSMCLPETWKGYLKGIDHYLDVTLDQITDPDEK